LPPHTNQGLYELFFHASDRGIEKFFDPFKFPMHRGENIRGLWSNLHILP
jgi:hypothetical protein